PGDVQGTSCRTNECQAWAECTRPPGRRPRTPAPKVRNVAGHRAMPPDHLRHRPTLDRCHARWLASFGEWVTSDEMGIADAERYLFDLATGNGERAYST